MSARRAHPKSKMGCADCKRRRIKCDENRPDCLNCHRRGIHCSFRVFDPAPHSKPAKSEDSSRERVASMIHVFSMEQAEVPKDCLSQDSFQDMLLQGFPMVDRLKMKTVLSHFATEAIDTLSAGTASCMAWREVMAKLAAQQRFVLHGILAIGCLHLSTLVHDASEKDEYQDLAATQMNIGMSQYRDEVKDVKTSNAEALFAFSTIITTFVLFTAGNECRTTLESFKETRPSVEHRKELVSTLAHSICRTFRAIRGVLVILVPCYHHLRQGKLEPILDRSWWPPPFPVTTEEIEVDQKIRSLEAMWSQPGKSYEYAFDTFRSAHKSLREDFALVSRLATCSFPGNSSDQGIFDWTAALQWPIQLNLEFLSLLEQHRMECWVLLAHYAVLPNKATNSFWLKGFATNIVTTSALVIGEENWDWIAWPVEVVGVDLENLRETPTTS